MKKLDKIQFAGIMIAIALLSTLITGIIIACINYAKTKQPHQPAPKVEYDVSETIYEIASDSNGEIWIQCYTKITNTGIQNLYLETGTFDLKDKESKKTYSFTATPHPQVIAPGETAMYYECKKMENQKLSDKYRQYEISLNFDAVTSTVPLIRYEVSELRQSDTLGVLDVSGAVTNTSPYSSYDCVIFIKVYNRSGDFLGIYDTYLTEEISPDEKVRFTIFALNSCFGVTPDNIGACIAVSYPYQYQSTK